MTIADLVGALPAEVLMLILIGGLIALASLLPGNSDK